MSEQVEDQKLRLHKLHVKNFLRFKDNTIDLKANDNEMLCFVGTNMRGKSTALAAIHVCGILITKTWDPSTQKWLKTTVPFTDLEKKIVATCDHLWHNLDTNLTATIALTVSAGNE
jgi:predicted ATP-binding protein involved in virulence